MPKFSPLAPRKRFDAYEGIRSFAPAFRSGMQRVSNGKPNRNPTNPHPFIAEAMVPFPFIGTDRKVLDRKRDNRGRYVPDTRTIPTPTVPDTIRKAATWAAPRGE